MNIGLHSSKTFNSWGWHFKFPCSPNWLIKGFNCWIYAPTFLLIFLIKFLPHLPLRFEFQPRVTFVKWLGFYSTMPSFQSKACQEFKIWSFGHLKVVDVGYFHIVVLLVCFWFTRYEIQSKLRSKMAVKSSHSWIIFTYLLSCLGKAWTTTTFVS